MIDKSESKIVALLNLVDVTTFLFIQTIAYLDLLKLIHVFSSRKTLSQFLPLKRVERKTKN